MLYHFDEREQRDSLDWGTQLNALDRSVRDLEEDLRESARMQGFCKGEWCSANRHVLDEIGNALFMISEPRCTTKAQSRRIKELKQRLHDLYAEDLAAVH
ncbi:MAG: hypothetical protein QNJ22_09655 [Desulfosarcinaceae bacterium]|nr:hypothetical protein [Desulfosarcinaceae bacterium]